MKYKIEFDAWLKEIAEIAARGENRAPTPLQQANEPARYDKVYRAYLDANELEDDTI